MPTRTWWTGAAAAVGRGYRGDGRYDRLPLEDAIRAIRAERDQLLVERDQLLVDRDKLFVELKLKSTYESDWAFRDQKYDAPIAAPATAPASMVDKSELPYLVREGRERGKGRWLADDPRADSLGRTSPYLTSRSMVWSAASRDATAYSSSLRSLALQIASHVGGRIVRARHGSRAITIS